jgi:hypothetical protein
MAGVKNIQVTSTIYYDDGYVVSINTPMWQKDIRHGDYFTDEEVKSVIIESGNVTATILDEKSLSSLHAMAVSNNTPKSNTKLKYNTDDPFSIN